MNLGISGRVALVGGGSRGLGRACAEQLALAGCRVAICARNRAQLGAVANEIRVTSGAEVCPVPADFSRPGETEHVVAETERLLGRVDILVVNSGGPKPGSFFDLQRSDWDVGYHDVLGYVIDFYRRVIPAMKERQWGRIINVSSIVVKQPSPALVLSTVFRTGVVALAKSLAAELVKHNVTINTVCPGAFLTDRALELLSGQARERGVSLESIVKERASTLPAGRYQEPRELGALVAFLASEYAAHLTGATIPIDEGISQGLM